MLTSEEILKQLPYSKPFLFVDEITSVNFEEIKGNYHFSKDEYFYKGHFKNSPVTPGVILTECAAQIGVVSFGIYLLAEENPHFSKENFQIALSSSEMEFYLPVYPEENVFVSAKKIYFRFNKLKCEVKMYNSEEKLVCKGTISGMLKINR
ncbi:3-hydroxyacyl-ACP dehydratase FabZ family protein [Mesonia maritima]|uniref:3-hydroxyacyl-[acyl-carrier-protein] dehydratase n=1 Tax=Mesonia maritima TaxID=1793873 RepID=A0ABU1K7M5_9FLAO|nr:hydroxymyristoyl-ACP dehydratase [Mesonia maritima]MDR6301605.1 3-hydroxyacyl-[acyl-carrier-protein] dehydratase [Mesonia maritima]